MSSRFHRNRPKTGRIIKFDEPRILDTSEDGVQLTGRFTNLLKKAKAEKPTTPGTN